MFEIPKAPNELAMDAKAFRLWLQPDLPDEERNLALKNMRVAVGEELTEKQKCYLVAYYVEGKKMHEIGEEYGKSRSTISRTLKTARKRLYKVLRYSSRALLSEALKS